MNYASSNLCTLKQSITVLQQHFEGSDNENLPAFIVLVSKNAGGQPLLARLWGNGFLPSKNQAVQFRSGKDPVLYLSDPEGYNGMDRREMLDYLKKLNQLQLDTYGDPEINTNLAI